MAEQPPNAGYRSMISRNLLDKSTFGVADH
jgi:hypothetical protein